MLIEELELENFYDEEVDVRVQCVISIYDTGFRTLTIGGYLTDIIKESLVEEKYSSLIIWDGSFETLSLPASCIKKIKHLSIRDAFVNDNFLKSLTHLETLEIDNDLDEFNEYDFTNNIGLKFLSLSSNNSYKKICKLKKLEALSLHNWQGDFETLKFSQNLKYLSITGNRKIVSLSGIHIYHNLLYLEIIEAPKLEKLDSISGLRKLKHLWLENCKLLINIEVFSKSTLEELSFFTKSAIKDIKPIADMSNLKYLGFGEGSKIINGNLSPLKENKSLQILRMSNEKHYEPNLKDILSLIKSNNLSKENIEYDWDLFSPITKFPSLFEYMPHEIIRGACFL